MTLIEKVNAAAAILKTKRDERDRKRREEHIALVIRQTQRDYGITLTADEALEFEARLKEVLARVDPPLYQQVLFEFMDADGHPWLIGEPMTLAELNKG